MNFPAGQFDIVLCDPPWSYAKDLSHSNQADGHYDLMTDEELLAFPVKDLLHKNSILFMWATLPRLDFAMDLLRSWAGNYRGMPFVWVKTKADGTPMGARGVRPSIVKPTCEVVLAGSPTRKGRPLKLHDETIRNTILAPITEHSRKPDDVHERIERMYPGASKLELFARRPRAGWQVWGNEVRGLGSCLPRASCIVQGSRTEATP